MGREADINDRLKAAAVERLKGPIREPKARDELGCEKCGSPKAAFIKRWCHGPIPLAGVQGQCETQGQHLHCQCQACGYCWDEHCVDHVPMISILPAS